MLTAELIIAMVDAATDRLLLVLKIFLLIYIILLLLVHHVLMVLGGGGLLGLKELGLELADSLCVHLDLLLRLVAVLLRPLAAFLFPVLLFDFELPLPLLEVSKLHLVI